jgi:hypothetical protein
MGFNYRVLARLEHRVLIRRSILSTVVALLLGLIALLVHYRSDIWIGVIALMLTLLIFLRQEKQLRNLRAIGEYTKDTAGKLHTNRSVMEMADRLFALETRSTGGGTFRCFFPVDYKQRPLPFIFSGDYHALQVLQSLLQQRLEPVPVRQTRASRKAHEKNGQSSVLDAQAQITSDGQSGGEIYLCSPQVNERLKKVAPAVELESDSGEATVPSFNGLDLPCWFANANWLKPPQKIIRVQHENLSLNLESPSESDYKEAQELEEGEAYDFRKIVRPDYAILLRLTQKQRTHLVVAGIHQYGTWIAGEFLKRLAHDEAFCPEINRGEDFAVVVWGEFDSKNFRVGECDILSKYLWIRRNDGWSRYLGKGVPEFGGESWRGPADLTIVSGSEK